MSGITEWFAMISLFSWKNIPLLLLFFPLLLYFTALLARLFTLCLYFSVHACVWAGVK
jgi:hypothetical protein